MTIPLTSPAGKLRSADAGFTLIETLVALAVLALAAVALLGSTTAHVSRIAGLEARAAASWTAENHLAALTLGLDLSDTPPPMLGFGFVLAVEATPTSDPDVQQLTILARGITDGITDGRNYARLTGFALRPGTGGQP